MANSFADKAALIESARCIVAGVIEDGCPLSAACIVSSLAAGDYTPTSDVDMLLVASDDQERPMTIFRTLAADTVVEWVVLPESYLKDTGEILSDAGLSHDIATAIIVLDSDNWLHAIQQEVARELDSPDWIAKRVAGQFKRTLFAIERSRDHLAAGNLLMAQRAHVSVLKGLFGIPRAAANKRCTMSRGLLFCRESAQELGWTDYVPDVLNIFGAQGISLASVTELQHIADRIINAAGFPDTEKAIRHRFLRMSQWLLDNAQPSDAVWPLYFWSSTTVEESGGALNPPLWELWQEFAGILRVGAKEDLAHKLDLAGSLVERHRALLRVQ